MDIGHVAHAICMASEYMDIEETARMLGISRYRVKQRAMKGEIPSKSFGNRTFFLKSDIEQFMRPKIVEGDFAMDDVLRELVQLFRENRRLRDELQEIERSPGMPERRKTIPYTSDLVNRATKLFD